MRARLTTGCVMVWCALAIASAASAQATSPASPPVTVLKAHRLFDGRGDTSIANGVVVVQGGKITAAGAGVAIPAGARVIDLGDVTLLPGFIDAHTHLTMEGSPDWNADMVADLRETVAEKALVAATYARKTLLAGFTTVRNVGAEDYLDVGLRNAINRGLTPGPRMLVSVYALGARGGHCDTTGFPYMRLGKETGPAEGIASGPDGFRDAVRYQVKYGADVIKVCATGGVLSLADEVDTPQLTQPEMDALVDEAHRLRKKTAAHAHGASGAKVAIRAGIDSIEHGSFLDDEALTMMKERGTYLVPTLMAGELVSREGRQLPVPARNRRQGPCRRRGRDEDDRKGHPDGREDRARHRFGGDPARHERPRVLPARAGRHDARPGAARRHARGRDVARPRQADRHARSRQGRRHRRRRRRPASPTSPRPSSRSS